MLPNVTIMQKKVIFIEKYYKKRFWDKILVYSHLKLIYTYVQVKVTPWVCPYVPLYQHIFGGDYFIHYCEIIPKSSFRV